MSDSLPVDGVPTLPPAQPSSPAPPSLPPRDTLPSPPPGPSDPVVVAASAPPPAASRPSFAYQPIPPLAPGQLPRGMVEVSPWGRLGAYLLESLLVFAVAGLAVLTVAVLDGSAAVSFLIVVAFVVVWSIWALMLGTGGQTPAKRMLGHTVIASDTHRPVGLGRMIFVRGVLGGFVAPIAVICTLGIVLFMPFWNKHNQNIWDRISYCYVVHRP